MKRLNKLFYAVISICVLLNSFCICSFADNTELINVAQNKPVTAGSYYNKTAGTGAKTAINDGDYETFIYASGKATDNSDGVVSPSGEEWFMIDLEQIYSVEKINLYRSAERRGEYNFRILASQSADFTNNYDIIADTGVDGRIELPLSVDCNGKRYRYIRIEKLKGTGSSPSEFAYTELEVMTASIPVNVALNKPINAGIYAVGTYDKAKLNDGDYTTFVYPGGTRTDNADGVISSAGNAWYTIDLEYSYSIDRICLYRDNDHRSRYNFRILASNSGEFDTYDIIADTGLNGLLELPLSVECNGKNYRYIRLEKLGGTHQAYNYTELEVWSDGRKTPQKEIDVINYSYTKNSDGEITGIECSLENKSLYTQNIMILTALFDGNSKLKQCKAYEKLISGNTLDIFNINFETTLSENGDNIKVFLWSGNNSPLKEAALLNYSNGLDFYVSPNGNDNNSGTALAPFKTIERAKQEVRKHNKAMTEDINIYLCGGIYTQEKTLEFDANDGGFNGYNVNYKAYNGETPIISGGIPVDGWMPYSGNIYYTSVSECEDIRELYVNGIKQKNAKSESKISPIDFYYENGVPQGFVVPGDIEISEEPSHIQLHFDKGYHTFILNACDMFKNSENKTVIKLMQPQFATCLEADGSMNGIKADSEFYLSNSLTELDAPGEFYYDRSDDYLYYYPTSGVDINNAKVYAPVLERLMSLKGTNLSNKVKNISFEGITFTHATWLEPSEIGMLINQAQSKYLADERGTATTGANIVLEACENVLFKNNVFTGLGMVGLGILNGSVNNNIIGNVFYDIGDSAITVATPDDAYLADIAESMNVAYNKDCSGTSRGAEAAVNGNAHDGWHLNIDDCDNADYTSGYWQVDLGTPTVIDKIEIDARKNVNQASTRRSFEVLGSNDPEFKTGVCVLATCDSVGFENEGTWSKNTMTSKPYRFVRIRKTVNEYFYLAEVRLLSYGTTPYVQEEVCKNNIISNNYITNIGNLNHCAPGIQTYYTDGTVITNNLIKNVPFSGIAVGWGWTANPDSVTCRNNVISNNVIDTFAMLGFDTGAIYLLGQQPGTTITGNYIKNQINAYGGIYPDDGSKDFSISNNVFENVNYWMFIWSDNKQNLTIDNNYTSSVNMRNLGKNCPVTGTTYFIPNNYPDGAKAIIAAAGLEEEYRTIVKNVAVGLDKPQEKDYYSNITNITVQPVKFINEYLATAIINADNILSLAQQDEVYSESACNELSKAISESQAVLYECLTTYNVTKAIEQMEKLNTAVDVLAGSIMEE